jgi:hypothetical protein
MQNFKRSFNSFLYNVRILRFNHASNKLRFQPQFRNMNKLISFLGFSISIGVLIHEVESICESNDKTNVDLNDDPFNGYRPNPEHWHRIDSVVLQSTKFQDLLKNNAFHDTLSGEGMLEKVEIYALVQQSAPVTGNNVNINSQHNDHSDVSKSSSSNGSSTNSGELIALIKYGDAVNGHPEVVHGGILALCFDNLFGWVFFASKLKAGFTANLNVNFRYFFVLFCIMKLSLLLNTVC